MNKLSQLTYLEIRRICSVRQYFSFEDAKTLLSSIVFSRLDYCNALPAGSLQVLLTKIQRLINCSAHLIFKVPKSAHITPFLYDLHWVPISSQIQYKIALICFHIVSGTVRPYLFPLLHLYSPRSLRSAADTRIFRVPRMGRRTLGRDPFNTLDLCSETPFLSLSGIRLHSFLLSQNLKLLCILICHVTNPSPVMHVFVVCVCFWHLSVVQHVSVVQLMRKLHPACISSQADTS